MVVALDLYHGFEAEPNFPSPSDVSLWGYDRREEMITALERSNDFCGQSKDFSAEAANAYRFFSFVIARARAAQRRILEAEQGNRALTMDAASLVSTGTALDLGSPGTFNGTLPDFDWVGSLGDQSRQLCD